MKLNIKSTVISSLTLVLSMFLYLLIGYFLERTESGSLLISFSLLFLGFMILMYQRITPLLILIIGLTFRLIFIISLPELSQDFNRFIWDGNLQIIGTNPYLFKPNYLINTNELFYLSSDLFHGMGELSNSNFSNYPPISQWMFLAASYLGENNIFYSVIYLRIFIIFFELCIFYISYQILNILKLPLNRIGWYFLNPLVIIELTGNLHGEGVMMFFFLLGILFLQKNKNVQSSIMMALSVGSKLLTLILIPVFFKKLGIKKYIQYCLLTVFVFLLLWIPYLDHNFSSNYIQTIKLWFNNFEFNASIYYIIREFGFYYKGYNIIQTFGKILPFILMFIICYFSLFQKNNTLKRILKSQLLLLTVYFFFATTVHPWYIISLVALCIFTPCFYPIVWSATVFFSYSSYTSNGFQENTVLILLEYIIVFSLFLYEMITRRDIIFKAFSKNLAP